MITNVPQIVIHASIVLTSSPPEIVEAENVLVLSRTNNIQQEIEAALKEIEFATAFLNERRKQENAEQTTTTNEVPTNQVNSLKN